MPQFFLLLAEVIALFFLSRSLTQGLYTLVHLLTRSRRFAISVLTLILFPGTVIHELAHLFTAEVLGVPTGRLTLAPESIRGEDVKTGSVAIAKTGPFRRSAIGMAPLVWGLVAFSIISYWLPQLTQELKGPAVYYLLFTIYLLFAVSNSMFPSPQDIAGTPAVGITIGLFLVSAYFVGFRFSLSGQALDVVQSLMQSLVQSTTIVLALNGALLLIVYVLIALTVKIRRRG